MEHVEDAVIDHWGTQTLPEDFSGRVRADLTTALDETNASARLLHDQLTAELAKIDTQEENLLDLAADASLATDKIRTRLSRLQAQRRTVQSRLKKTYDGLEQGAAVLTTQLDLLARPQALYQRVPDQGRRLLNQAMFDELFVDRGDDLKTKVVDQSYTEPVRDLMAAAQAYRRLAADANPTNADRPTVNGEPVLVTLTGPARTPISLDGGSSKTAMVDAGELSPNTWKRLVRLSAAWEQAKRDGASEQPQAAEPDPGVVLNPTRRSRTPLTPEEVDAIRTARSDGQPAGTIAKRFRINRGTVWETARGHARSKPVMQARPDHSTPSRSRADG